MEVRTAREKELQRAEQEALTQEQALGARLSAVQAEAEQLRRRASQLVQEAQRVGREGAAAPDVEQVRVRVALAAELPALELQGVAEKALDARLKAVSARQDAVREMSSALDAYALQLRKTLTRLGTDASELATLQAESQRAAKEARAHAEQQARVKAAAEADKASGGGEQQALSRSAVAPPGATTLPRRENSRVRMQAQVDLSSDSNFFTGFSTNLSEGGLFIATVERIALGTPVEVVFSVPGGAPLKVRGLVRWSREINDKAPEIFPGVGVQFLELDPQVAQSIKGFVAQREPLFFPD